MAIKRSLWQPNFLDNQLIDMAFLEDLSQPYRDVTTETLFPEIKGQSRAEVISKHSSTIVMCGLPVVRAVLGRLGSSCDLYSDYDDGDQVPTGATLLTLSGSAHTLLMSERILLNFLQRLCAVATLTGQFVHKVSHTAAQILDTRKTLPGWRHLDKYAVQCGGGVNHRMGLYDAIMIKDTHIDLLGGIVSTLDVLPENIHEHFPIIVEVRSLQELVVTLDKGINKVSRVLLDNMSPVLMRECVAMCQGIFKTEASGNITLDKVAEVAQTGVDFISIGRLTHSAGNVDLSMRCDI